MHISQRDYKKTDNMPEPISIESINSEETFKAIGLAYFFNINEDNNVDWENIFSV